MNYGFLSGVIKYRENFLLDSTDIERMADAKDGYSAFQVLNDTDYGDNMLDVETENYQQALDDDLKQVKDLFVKHLDKELLKFLFLRYDVHNIKLFLKSKYSKKNLDKYVSPLGIEDPKKIKEYVELSCSHSNIQSHRLPISKGFSAISDTIDGNIKHIINKAEEFIADRPFPHRIDYIVDREYFHTLHNIAKNIGGNYIKNLVSLQIDIANLKILLRAKTTNKPYEFVEKKFIKYGGVEIEELKNLYNSDLYKEMEFYKNYFKNKELSYILDNFKQDGKIFWKIEKALENLELTHIKKTKFIAYGPEVVIGYCYGKKNAVRNLRLIMTGKINNVPAGEIKERLSKIY